MILPKPLQLKVNKVAEKLGIPIPVASVAYRSYWLSIKETIENLPDLSTISEEEFNKLQVNFNIQKLGKLTTNFKKIQKANKFKQIINERISTKESNTTS